MRNLKDDKQFVVNANHMPLTEIGMIAEHAIDRALAAESKVELMKAALTVVRDSLDHKKNDDRTSWSLWNISNEALNELELITKA